MHFTNERSTNGVLCKIDIEIVEIANGPYFYKSEFAERESLVPTTHLLRVAWEATRGEGRQEGRFDVHVESNCRAARVINQLLDFQYQLTDKAIKELQAC